MNPGQLQEVSGDPARGVRASAATFRGAHTDNPAYFDRPETEASPFGRILRLRTVCWLEVRRG